MPDTTMEMEPNKMNIDEKQRELFRRSAEQIESQATKQIAAVKAAKTTDELNDAVRSGATRRRTWIKNIEEGDLGNGARLLVQEVAGPERRDQESSSGSGFQVRGRFSSR